jgi:CHASE3 domain sensor protein
MKIQNLRIDTRLGLGFVIVLLLATIISSIGLWHLHQVAAEKVEAGVKQVGDSVGEITSASNEQASEIAQINQASVEMDQVGNLSQVVSMFQLGQDKSNFPKIHSTIAV